MHLIRGTQKQTRKSSVQSLPSIRLPFHSRDKWIDMWRPIAAHVKQSETIALSYQLAISDEDPLLALVFERHLPPEKFSPLRVSLTLRSCHLGPVPAD